MRKILLIALLLAGCGSGGGGGSSSAQPPIGPSWTALYGANIDASSGSFNFPGAPGIHYVAKPAPAVKLGQTITLTFQISGSGTWGFDSQTPEGPPATIHLFLWERGDDGTGSGAMETYREWCGRTDISNPATYTVKCVVNPTNWTGVFGQTPSPALFQQLLNNLYGVGFTFGGGSFAGHGLYSATGSFRFNLVSYTIQ